MSANNKGAGSRFGLPPDHPLLLFIKDPEFMKGVSRLGIGLLLTLLGKYKEANMPKGAEMSGYVFMGIGGTDILGLVTRHISRWKAASKVLVEASEEAKTT